MRPSGAAAVETDASMRLGALGVKGRVLEPRQGDGLALDLRSDAMWVRTETERTQGMVASEADATRLRLVLEGERAYDLGAGATITPTGEIGVRHDAGDAETGAGLELGAGLRYSSGRFAAEGRVRGLVAHEDDGHREWGASGSIRLAARPQRPGPEPLGRSRVGGAGERHRAAVGRARRARTRPVRGPSRPSGASKAKVGYGFALARNRGLLTPYAGRHAR